MRIRFLISAIVVAVLSTSALAASKAWFGLKPPPALSDPHRPVVDVANVKLPPAAIPAGEEKFSELRGARIYQDVKAITDFSKHDYAAGNLGWGRITGFPAAKATIEWHAEQFKKAGLKDVQVQEYDAAASSTMWNATKWEARLIGDPAYGAGSGDVVLHSAVPTGGSMIAEGELTAELVDAGATTDAKLPDVNVRGKVAVQRLHPQAGAFSERTKTVERAQELSKRGAVAVLNVVEQTGNMHVRDFGNCGAPCFNLGGADGAFVEGAMMHAAKSGAPLKIKLQLTAEKLAGLKGHNAIGIVPGKSDETIIVNAHADGWYDAAGDNGDGSAVLQALARHFAKPENKPERTLIFVASGGHHSSGLNGPQNLVRMNPGLVAKTVMVLNLEHIAQMYIRSETWTVDPTEQPMNFGIDNMAPALVALGKRGVERYGFNLRPEFTTTVAGDLGGYAPLGVARVQAIHSGPMYHVSGDVLETISVPGLERAARFYAFFVAEAAKLARDEINPPKK
ncbi:MAG TPA: M28 family peptidase [Steroidobacteraceae bacterium]|nr:M28 family peptidase [Steroidobacteraceae bacterium]